MVKTKQNFTMVSGDTQILEFEVLDSGGVAVNITGAVVTWVLCASRLYPTALITKTTSSGITLTNPTSGIFQVTLLPVDTQSLSGIYFHEAQVVVSGNTYTVSNGNAIIEGDVIV
jgi:phage terminase large subunit-like protein